MLGDRVARATLTREKSLNSLTLETINQLLSKIEDWLNDDAIACIVLDSSSERALCAGADITALYHNIKNNEIADADAFFTNEYRLDHMLHTAEKPILAWGGGVVMGGGLGLLAGCSHRVGTPDNRIAMPEITIGLFPDAGGTWLLSRMPDGVGVFAGMTGCQLSAGDALELGILDYVLEHEDKSAVMEAIARTEWSDSTVDNQQKLTQVLKSRQSGADLPQQLLAHREAINALVESAYAADDFFAEFESGLAAVRQDEWLQGAIQTYQGGSPTTARIFHEQLERCREMTLAETFQMELAIACQCVRHPDFPEGVRALLVDKDRNPSWVYKSTAEVPSAYVAEHFEPSWAGEHPLAGS